MTDVEEIKSKIDIVDFIGQYVTLKKAGSNHKAPCPFHQERTPSFMVSRDKQIFKCFGCSEGGDVISFLMKQENLEFREALQILADKVGIQLEKSKPKQVYEEEKNTKNRLLAINALAAELYHKILCDHPVGQAARDYLRERKLTNQTIEEFKIGYGPRKDVLTQLLSQRGFTAQEFRAAGSPEMFHHRIVFPIFDQIGNVVGFSARALDPKDEPKYLNTRETVLYHKSRIVYGLHQAKQAIKQAAQAVVVEGQMDVVASHQAGVPTAVASSGTALTEDHLRILARLTPTVVFAFDADEAGLKAAMSAIELALPQELVVRLVTFPNGIKDTGELVASDPRAWPELVKTARPFVDWLLDRLVTGKPETIEVKKAIGKKILPFVARVGDPIERATYVRLLSERLQISERSIQEALEKDSARATATKNLKTDEPPMPKISAKASLEATVYGLLILHPNFQKEYEPLYQALAKWYNRQRQEIELMVEEQYRSFDEGAVGEELRQLVTRLRERKREKIKVDFAQRIAKAQAAGNRAELKQLLEQLQATIR
ncbi:MAG: DNA primase [Patescibacteria group bacterium]